MQEQLAIERTKTAVLVMDYQGGMSNRPDGEVLLGKAAMVLRAAREAGFTVIYVVVRFREGYPEVSSRNKTFSNLMLQRRLREGTPEGDVHPGIAPQPGDIVVVKRRTGAFSTTDLDAILRAKNIDTLVLFGIATGGVVLSTVRWGADLDYRMVVLSDCCADGDEEVHRVLVQKVFPRQATVMESQNFVGLVEGALLH
ncbi:MAG: cysteine hydrolase [Chloroflexi bacterium]|nr:cysteine hydrolase [Chloroflexota bacterium]